MLVVALLRPTRSSLWPFLEETRACQHTPTSLCPLTNIVCVMGFPSSSAYQPSININQGQLSTTRLRWRWLNCRIINCPHFLFTNEQRLIANPHRSGCTTQRSVFRVFLRRAGTSPRNVDTHGYNRCPAQTGQSSELAQRLAMLRPHKAWKTTARLSANRNDICISLSLCIYIYIYVYICIYTCIYTCACAPDVDNFAVVTAKKLALPCSLSLYI